MLWDVSPLRVRQEDFVDSVTVDAIIYNLGGSHLGAFPGPLLSANHQKNEASGKYKGSVCFYFEAGP